LTGQVFLLSLPVRPVRFLLFLALPVVVLGFKLAPDFSLGYQAERGVEAKGLINAGLDARWFSFLALNGSLSFSFLEHNGLSGYGLGIRYKPVASGGWNLSAGFQGQRWCDWQATELRGYILLQAQPAMPLVIGLGLCRRQPFFSSQPGLGEWNLLYLLRLRFWGNERFSASAELGNYQRREIKNPQQFPFGLSAGYRLNRALQLFASCGSAVNGFSAGLVSFPEIRAELGIEYE